MAKKAPMLPTNYAFVVQFRSSADGTLLRCEGRVEHLVSGQAMHFSSWEHLRAFIEQVLCNVCEKPPSEAVVSLVSRLT